MSRRQPATDLTALCQMTPWWSLLACRPMAEQLGRDDAGTGQTIRHALWVAFAGHLIALIAAGTHSLGAHPTSAAAIACSIIAVMALTELAPSELRARRVLIGGHGLAAMIIVAGQAPGVPAASSLVGLVGAAALGVVALVASRRASLDPHRPLSLAPRVAAVALLVPALVQAWLASTNGLSMRLHAAIFVGLVALGAALLASLSIIAIRTPGRWVIAGLVAWTLGWVAMTADLGALIGGALGGPAPMGPHQLRVLDAGLVQAVATVGGLVIGSAIASSFHDARTRHSAVVLLVGYAVFGLLVAGTEHRIELVTDFPGLTALRKDRDLADAIRSFAQAGLMWQCWRQVANRGESRQTDRERRVRVSR